MENTIIIIATILLLSSASAFVNAEASSIIEIFEEGYELGKRDGISDFTDSDSHNNKCQPNDSLSYCTGYKKGYEAGWIASAILEDN